MTTIIGLNFLTSLIYFSGIFSNKLSSLFDRNVLSGVCNNFAAGDSTLGGQNGAGFI